MLHIFDFKAKINIFSVQKKKISLTIFVSLPNRFLSNNFASHFFALKMNFLNIIYPKFFCSASNKFFLIICFTFFILLCLFCFILLHLAFGFCFRFLYFASMHNKRKITFFASKRKFYFFNLSCFALELKTSDAPYVFCY